MELAHLDAQMVGRLATLMHRWTKSIGRATVEEVHHPQKRIDFLWCTSSKCCRGEWSRLGPRSTRRGRELFRTRCSRAVPSSCDRIGGGRSVERRGSYSSRTWPAHGRERHRSGCAALHSSRGGSGRPECCLSLVPGRSPTSLVIAGQDAAMAGVDGSTPDLADLFGSGRAFVFAGGFR